MTKTKINHLAVWILIVLYQIVPAVWYSEAAFGRKWMALNGLAAEDFANTPPASYVVALVGAGLTCYLTAWLFARFRVATSGKGMMLGFLFGFVFIFGNALATDLFSLRPALLTLINGGLAVLLFTAMGLVLGGWSKTAAV